MSDDRSKSVVPRNNSSLMSKISRLAKRGLQVSEELTADQLRIKKKLNEILEFYSTPPNSPDGRPVEGDYEAGHLSCLYMGNPTNEGGKWIVFVNSNATAILFPSDSPDSIMEGLIFQDVQRAFKPLNEAKQLESRGRYGEAEILYWDSLKIHATPEAYVNLGNLYFRQGKYKEAELICHRGIKTTRVTITNGTVDANEYDVFAVLYANLGFALQSQGKLAEAEKAMRKSVLINPTEWRSLFNFANLLYKLNKPEEAEATYRKVIKFNPKNANVYFNLALLLSELERVDEANLFLTKALQLDPNLEKNLNR